jgi:hypothetical protein
MMQLSPRTKLPLALAIEPTVRPPMPTVPALVDPDTGEVLVMGVGALDAPPSRFSPRDVGEDTLDLVAPDIVDMTHVMMTPHPTCRSSYTRLHPIPFRTTPYVVHASPTSRPALSRTNAILVILSVFFVSLSVALVAATVEPHLAVFSQRATLP